MDERIVIVGAGQAGGELATGLRKQGYTGRVVLIGDEAHLPYRRPPLSKGFLQGSHTRRGNRSLRTRSLARGREPVAL